MTIDLTTFGTVNISVPALSTCFDLVSHWTDSQSRAVTGRLCAMAICICADDMRLPKTRHLVNVDDYGTKCLNTLLNAGVDVNQILEQGMACIEIMAKALPTTAEVKETENFTELVAPAE